MSPIHRYTTGMPYRLATGRNQQQMVAPVGDRLARQLAVIDLARQRPTPGQFIRPIRRELKIRHYAVRTIKSYLSVTRSILRWFGRPPHLLTREHVREYLEYLYDAGHSASDISVHLSAIRTIWDKFCYCDVTLGLETPRRRRKRPVILSRDEVRRLLAAAPSLRDTLLLGLMYGAGLRVSEVVRVQWRDIDVQRNQIFIRQAKGNADRHVQLPIAFRELISQSASASAGQPSHTYVFPGQSQADRRRDRHLSPRTVQRVVQMACRSAGIRKQVTPHSLRHAFATHSFESGCDIRRIQKVLGHVRLETTTLYVTVAKERTNFRSPWDDLKADATLASNSASIPANPSCPSPPTETLNDFRLHSRRAPEQTGQPGQPESVPASDAAYQFTIETRTGNQRHFLTGIVGRQTRPGFIQIEMPPQERWQATIDQLPTRIVERLHSPDFYELLREKISGRLLREIQQATPEPGKPQRSAASAAPP